MLKREVYLLRHGLTEDHELLDGKAVLRGRTDTPLSHTGWQQMHKALEGLNFQQLVSSPLQRCAAFAGFVAKQKQLALTIEPDLQEIDFGQWDGQTTETIASHSKEALLQFWSDPVKNTPPDAESLTDFYRRVVQCWNTILRTPQIQNPQKSQKPLDTLLVIHAGVQKIILAHILDMPLSAIHNIEVPYACCSTIQVYYNEDDIKATLKQHGH